MSSIYEAARRLRMPGLEVTALLYPNNLTKRLFNSVRSMIASGIVKGNGGASQVAKHVLSTRNVTHLKTTSFGIMRYGSYQLSREAREEAIECYEAYIMMQKANDHGAHNSYWDGNLKRAYEFFDGLPNARWLHMGNLPEMRDRIAKIYSDSRSDITLQNTADLLKQFDAGEPFIIDIFED